MYSAERYQRHKRRARSEAIGWQLHFESSEHYQKFSIFEWQEHFKSIGKKYGLIKEFKEKGII